jgi:hypothetical protein
VTDDGPGEKDLNLDRERPRWVSATMKEFGIADSKEGNDVFEIEGAGGAPNGVGSIGPWQLQLTPMIPVTSSNG